MKVILIVIGLFLTAEINSQTNVINIIPQPAIIEKPEIASGFSITPSTQIVLEGSNMDNSVNFFNDYLQQFYLFKLKVVKTSTSKNAIRLNYEMMENELPGAYKMTVDSKGVYIAGDNEEGVFYGIQSLIQLLPIQNQKSKTQNIKLSIPFVSIEDAPRFAWRGLHLDVGRHFMPVDFIKKYIDYIALHKMNYFHWHLTEDQGWRIEIKKYPKLTSVGGWRNGTIIGRYPGTGNDGIKYGGFYTQEQIKEIVKYAAERYITVVPEIEMPGHSSAAIAAYPELSCFPDEPTINYFPKNCKWNGDSTGKQVQQTWGVFDDVFCAGKETTFKFLEDVMDEVLSLFPSKYVHIGGDECPKIHWKKCPACQQRMKDNGLKDEHELQSYFIQRMEKYLNKKGRTLIGWDEILEGGLAPNAVVMSWRGEQGGIDAAKQNHDVIMTPGNPVYFDHTQSENEDSVTIGGYNPIEKVYAYEPIPKELNAEQAKHVLGAQANMWTEYMKNTQKVEYMLFPRLSALSEVLWSKKEYRDWNDFEKKLMGQFKRYDLWKVNYSKAYFDFKSSVLPTDNYSGVSWSVANKFNMSSTNFYEIKHLSEPDTIAVYDPKDISKIIRYDTTYTRRIQLKYSSGKNPEEIHINKSGIFEVQSYNLSPAPDGSYHFLRDRSFPVLSLEQKIYFNKATGKKITLTNPASDKYPGDGAFTLVNGVINEKGFAKSREFLGFNGTNCEAVIDLGSSQLVSFVVVNTLNRISSWIWRPLTAEVFGSGDGQSWTLLKLTDNFQEKMDGTGKGMMTMSFKATYARYVKVVVTNWGEILYGNPGVGNKAWLFVDEIEVSGPTAAELGENN
jgi:hexosaminidase